MRIISAHRKSLPDISHDVLEQIITALGVGMLRVRCASSVPEKEQAFERLEEEIRIILTKLHVGLQTDRYLVN
jgi:hypothetical protein